jgi:hypothetical protein
LLDLDTSALRIGVEAFNDRMAKRTKRPSLKVKNRES